MEGDQNGRAMSGLQVKEFEVMSSYEIGKLIEKLKRAKREGAKHVRLGYCERWKEHCLIIE